MLGLWGAREEHAERGSDDQSLRQESSSGTRAQEPPNEEKEEGWKTTRGKGEVMVTLANAAASHLDWKKGTIMTRKCV